MLVVLELRVYSKWGIIIKYIFYVFKSFFSKYNTLKEYMLGMVMSAHNNSYHPGEWHWLRTSTSKHPLRAIPL